MLKTSYVSKFSHSSLWPMKCVDIYANMVEVSRVLVVTKNVIKIKPNSDVQPAHFLFVLVLIAFTVLTLQVATEGK